MIALKNLALMQNAAEGVLTGTTNRDHPICNFSLAPCEVQS